MRIEEVTKQVLVESNDKDLRLLRLRFMQVWNKNFKANIVKTVGSLSRNDLVTKYRLLLTEMQSRSLQHSTEDIDRLVFKKAMQIRKIGIDLDQFETFTDVESYVVISKDFREAPKISITIRDYVSNRSEVLENEISKLFKATVDKGCVFAYSKNLSGEVIPLFHKVLQPVQEVKQITLEGNQKDDSELGEKQFEKSIILVPIIKGDEHIVYGIVYEPDTTDSQGDAATAEEIKKAAYQFMEKVQVFKVNHEGGEVDVKVLESYLAPTSFSIGKKKVKKGTWILVTRVLDEKVWKDIKAGKLTGYSMAGYAKVN